MKRLILGMLGILLILMLSIPAGFAQGNTDAITFSDPAVEALLRGQLGKNEGDISREDLLAIEEFLITPFADDDAAEIVYLPEPMDVQIETLADLAHCANLRTITLYSQPVDSIEALESLEKLESVFLVHCFNLKDITPLGGKESLKKVVLMEVPVSDFAPVFALPHLEHFAASGFEGAPDLSALENTRSLVSFQLRGVPEGVDYSPLTNHSMMKRVELYHLDSAAFAALVDSWAQLESLSIASSSVTGDDLAALSGHKLTVLKLFNCREVTDLSWIAPQQSLRSLFLMDCGVEDIAPLTDLESLTVRLLLWNNPISDYSPLAKMQNLEHLDLSEISGQYSLESLQEMLPNTNITIMHTPPVVE